MKTKISYKKHLKALAIGAAVCLSLSGVGVVSAEEEAVPDETKDYQHDEAEKEGNPNEYRLESMYVFAKRMGYPPPYAGGQVARGSRVGILGVKDFMDTPFNTTSYTAQNIADKQARSLYDLMMQDPTVRFQYSAGSFQDNLYIRNFGFNTLWTTMNGMVGMMPAWSVPMEMFERVEVHRGPISGFISGMNPGGEVAGGINFVTKHAGDEPIKRVAVDYMSDSQFGAHLDLGQRFGESKEFGVRFNGVVRNGDAGIKDRRESRNLASLGLDYNKDRWNIMFDTYYNKDKYNGASPFTVQMNTATTKLLDAPDYRNGINGLSGQVENKGTLFHADYFINDKISAFAGIGRTNMKAKGVVGGAIFSLSPSATGTGSLSATNLNYWYERSSYEAGLKSKFETGKVKHEVVIGGSKVNLKVGTGALNAFTGAVSTNMYNPVFDSSLISSTRPNDPLKAQEINLSSVGIADTLSFNNDKALLTLGVRKQNVHRTTNVAAQKYDKEATTPIVALVVKPWGEKTSLYANYVQGLTMGATVSNTAAVNFGEILPPFKTEQYEFGVKFDTGKLANTISLYQIKRPSLVYEESGTGVIKGVSGEQQRNKGIEWISFGELSDSVRILGGMSCNKADIKATDKSAAGVPSWQANLGFEWDATKKKDVVLSLGMVHTGRQWMDTNNTMKLPSWTRFDFGVKYKSKIDKTPVTFRFNVENLFDKNYWAGLRAAGPTMSVLTVGTGRTYKLSASFDI